jgi:TPP-dependent trihydroxycyclohexane-1,2-dione (THcHDO) dehydratase
MPNTFKVSEVLTIIKKKLHLTKEQQQGIILLADGKYLMKHDELLTNIYEKYRDKQDGFLYIVFAEEQVYGGDF